MQYHESSLPPLCLYIEQWRQTVSAACDTDPADQSFARDRPDASSYKRRRPTSRRISNVPAMSSPPPSDRAQSPPKRMMLAHRNRDLSIDDNNDPFLAHASLPDLDQTPRRDATAGIVSSAPQLPPLAPRSIASYTSNTQTASAPSRTTTWTTKSRARSTSPMKKTQSLTALLKPIFHEPLSQEPLDGTDNQLPENIRVLYNRLYGITVDHEGIAPWEVREEIDGQVPRPWRESCFKRMVTPSGPGGGDAAAEEEERRGLARAELKVLRKIMRVAWMCRKRGRSEAAWNTMVHAPLLHLALDRPEYAHVGWEVITTAQITKPFVPPMGDSAPTEFADKKMVDLAMVLEPVVDNDSKRKKEAKQQVAGQDHAASEQRFRRLAHAIQRVVSSQPHDKQTINQSLYTALLNWPIGISIETKANAASDAGRVQLAIWTAAWHERMRDIMMTAGKWSSDTRLITMPLLLIVDHTWLLSFACDRGDRLEVVGEMAVGETASVKGLYTLVVVLRELAAWMQGPFAEWMLGVLEGDVDI